MSSDTKPIVSAKRFRELDPKGVTEYRCYHGISRTYPCPDCFIVSEGIPPRDRSGDWQAIYEENDQ